MRTYQKRPELHFQPPKFQRAVASCEQQGRNTYERCFFVFVLKNNRKLHLLKVKIHLFFFSLFCHFETLFKTVFSASRQPIYEEVNEKTSHNPGSEQTHNPNNPGDHEKENADEKEGEKPEEKRDNTNEKEKEAEANEDASKPVEEGKEADAEYNGDRVSKNEKARFFLMPFQRVRDAR